MADLYAVYEQDEREGFPEKEPRRLTDEERWVGDKLLTRPDDLRLRRDLAAETERFVPDFARGERSAPAPFMRFRHDRPSEHRWIWADDPNLERLIDAGWVVD